jgi:hypothetical protein
MTADCNGPYRPDAIRQRDANFKFSMTFNFTIFHCFSNIWNHLSNFSYLVCIFCKMFMRWRFYLFLKTENSRRVVESRSVCMDLNPAVERDAVCEQTIEKSLWQDLLNFSDFCCPPYLRHERGYRKFTSDKLIALFLRQKCRFILVKCRFIYLGNIYIFKILINNS